LTAAIGSVMLPGFSSVTPGVDGASAVFPGFNFNFPADLSVPRARAKTQRSGPRRQNAFFLKE
jgi:hypothetical protein